MSKIYNNENYDMFSIGAHCSVENCRRLDYLPFTCICKKVTCKEHRFNHECTVKKNTENTNSSYCDICNQYICNSLLMSKHIESECKNYVITSLKMKQHCAKKGCKSYLTMPITCEKCNQLHCISHRLPIDHFCNNLVCCPT